MKDLTNVKNWLLPMSYRKYGVYLIAAGIPLVIFVFTFIVVQSEKDMGSRMWDLFGSYFLHVPLSLGLFWMLFSAEQEEDELFTELRLKAAFHAIRFTFIAILFLPGLALLKSWYTGEVFEMPEIGGNLAVVTLLLFYANVSYWYMKSQVEKDEE